MIRKLEQQKSNLPAFVLRVGRWLLQASRIPLVEWGLLLLSILPFILISAYNHPTDDDFQGARLARYLGLWESVGFYYDRWTGRYTSSFLYGLSYEAPNLNAWLLRIRIAPVLFLIAFFLSGRFAVGVLNKRLGNATKWRVAGYFLVLYLCGIPLIASAFYWMSGSAVYTSGVILVLWLIGCLGKFEQADTIKDRNMWGGLAGCSAFLLSGTNELCMLIMLIGLLMWAFYSQSKFSFWQIMIISAAVVGAVITSVAPGNFARSATIPNHAPIYKHILTTVSKTAYLSTIHIVRWVTNGLLLLAAGIVIVSSPRYPLLSKRRNMMLVGGCFGVMLTYALTIPIIWLTNDVPSRIWNVIYFVFLLSWLIFLYFVSRWKGFRGLRHRSLPYHSTMRVIWLLLILFRQDTNVHQAYIDLAFKARAYNTQQQHRYKLLQQAREQNQLQVRVPPLLEHEYQYPSTIFLHELEPFAFDIANVGMAQYFGLDSVYITIPPKPTRGHFRE